MNKMVLSLSVCLLAWSSTTLASESSHFKAEKVETLSQAVKVFSEYNQKFAAIVAKDRIELKEMGEVHQMTYSMENALRKIKREVAEMEYLLEEVHEASEHGQPQTVIKDGRQYLKKAQTLIP